MNRSKKQIWLLVSVLLATCALVGCVFLVKGYISDRRAQQQLEALRAEVKQTPPASAPVSAEPAATAAPEAATADEIPASPEPTVKVSDPKPDIPIDFDTLQKTNPDIYAWVSIPDTAVDFPVVQGGPDNGYYLTHDIYGQESDEGSVFTEDYNSKDFDDFNTVIYGHNLKSGAVFAPLMNYRDRDFFDEHRTITVYTPDTILTYEIFAAYVWDDRHILLSFDFADEKVRSEYLAGIFSIREMSANIDKDAAVTAKDRILTLSTCTYTNGERYLVQGVLTKVEQ